MLTVCRGILDNGEWGRMATSTWGSSFTQVDRAPEWEIPSYNIVVLQSREQRDPERGDAKLTVKDGYHLHRDDPKALVVSGVKHSMLGEPSGCGNCP